MGNRERFMTELGVDTDEIGRLVCLKHPLQRRLQVNASSNWEAAAGRHQLMESQLSEMAL
jgi:hypothetical protein